MEESYRRKLPIWERSGVAVQDLFGWTGDGQATKSGLSGPHNPVDFAHRLFAAESLNSPARRGEEVEPYSLQWFLNIESQRHGRQGRWIPRLMEFSKHSGETLLGLGHGLGTDWAQYARHGAHVIVCSPSTSQLGLIRRNFDLRGLQGRFIHALPACLPLESASIDVACISSLGKDGDEVRAMADEVYRVLKPGGKVLAVTRARFDVDFWNRTLFFWQRWLGPRLALEKRTEVGFAGREMRTLFGRFIEQRVHKRQLRRSEVPHALRWLPLPFLARIMGRFLVLKAFKPLSTAISAQTLAA